jgi:hypothetical protein
MKIKINKSEETIQAWPQEPFLAYDVELPHVVMLVIKDKHIFLSGSPSYDYPYEGTQRFSERCAYRKHALFSGKIELEND